MADPARQSDPDLNTLFAHDWGAGRFHARLADEAKRWLEQRRKLRAQAASSLSRHARMRSWRAST